MLETDELPWEWWASADQELYTVGPCVSREQVIEEGRRGLCDHENASFHIIEAKGRIVQFSAERLIEDQYYEQDDWFNFDDGPEPDRQGKTTTIKQADDELQALLDGWCAKWRHTFIKPTMFGETRNAEVIHGA